MLGKQGQEIHRLVLVVLVAIYMVKNIHKRMCEYSFHYSIQNLDGKKCFMFDEYHCKKNTFTLVDLLLYTFSSSVGKD